MEKMLITQALDERDLLRKKIMDKIKRINFVDTIKRNEDLVRDSRVTKEEYKKQVEADYQQIESFIDRYQKIEAAIVLSNANSKIKTSYGEYSIAEAIAIKRRLSQGGDFDEDFEDYLCDRLKDQLDSVNIYIDNKNRDLQNVADNMRLSILGKDSKVKEDRPLDVVDTYVKENTTEIVDPININDLINKLTERKDKLNRELDTAIKVSNATTFIEI